MPKAERTATSRLAIKAQTRFEPDLHALQALEQLLDKHAQHHNLPSEIREQLPTAAFYLAVAITTYANAKRAGISDTKFDHEEEVRVREDKAARLLTLAREMEQIMADPACRHLAMFPPDERTLLGLLQKLIKDHESRTPTEEARPEFNS